jgi:general secretion pathway protein A
LQGVTTPLFTDEAIKVIYEATRGAARAIGGLSCSCLLHAMSANAKLVDDHSVKLVLENEYRKESMAAAEASLLSAAAG